MSRLQFGRLCQLEFRNYSTEKKFKIDQNLRISFDFLKSFDESDQSSTGTISIYGLSKETAFKLGNRLGNNFQSEVTCSVGYSGDIENFQPLFVGTVMNNHWKREGGVSVTTIEVSANFKSFYLGQMQAVSARNVRFAEILGDLTRLYNVYYEVKIVNDQITYSDEDKILTYLSNVTISNWSFVGNMFQYLEKISKGFGFKYRLENEVVYFTMTDLTEIQELLGYIDFTNQDLANNPKNSATIELKRSQHLYAGKMTSVIVAPTTSPSVETTQMLDKLFKNSNEKTAITVGFGTGLVAMPQIDNRNVKVPYNQQLGANEAIIERKGVRAVIDKKTGEHKKDKDGNLRYTKPPKNITISRRYMTALIQLNPAIKPNSMVRINTSIPEIDGVYRARNCKFKGDTHEGEWVVELDLEDTMGFDPKIEGLDDEEFDAPIEGLTENITNNSDGDDDAE